LREHRLLAAGKLLHLGLGDAEVEQLDPDLAGVLTRKEDVGRLDVAVHDAAFVGLGQPQAGLDGDAQGEVGG
jgi:hypothetical protein